MTAKSFATGDEQHETHSLILLYLDFWKTDLFIVHDNKKLRLHYYGSHLDTLLGVKDITVDLKCVF